jgi:hypothetical protein
MTDGSERGTLDGPTRRVRPSGPPTNSIVDPPSRASDAPALRTEARLYPFSEGAALVAVRPVSPFRLPLEIEAALWDPWRYAPATPAPAKAALAREP